jgi:hypothetical protein
MREIQPFFSQKEGQAKIGANKDDRKTVQLV